MGPGSWSSRLGSRGRPSELPQVPADLKFHGSAARCLLRLRENEGKPFVSDTQFIAKYLSRFPAWHDRPGALSGEALLDLVQDLGIATEIEWTRDYDQLVEEHAAGNGILVLTEHVPLPTGRGRKPHATVSLVVELDQEGFVLWWPSPSGDGEVLPRTDRVWWSRWPARAAVLRRAGTVAPGLARSGPAARD